MLRNHKINVCCFIALIYCNTLIVIQVINVVNHITVKDLYFQFAKNYMKHFYIYSDLFISDIVKQ